MPENHDSGLALDSIFSKYSTTGILEDEARQPIRTLGGERLAYCKACGDFVQVKERVTGRMKATDASGNPMLIFIDEVYGACSHLVRDESH